MSKFEQRKRYRKNSSSNSEDDALGSKKIHVDGYDDKYFGDADDRAWLKTLSEREREAELLKRHEQREMLKHREEISKKLKSKKIDHDDTDNETKPKSNSFDQNIYAEDEDEDYSSANRRKQVNASKQQETQHSKTLKALMEERKKKLDVKVKKSLPKPVDFSSSDDEVTEKKTKPRREEKLNVSDVFTSSSSDDDSHHRRRSRSPNAEKTDADKQETKRKRCTFITKKSQLKPIILSRFRMEKWCHAPFFNQVVKGAFVRINIGQNNGVTIYRVCEILGVVETSKIYNLGTTRTNKGLRLKYGRNERMFRLEFVSNSEISDTEFTHWRETLIKYNVSLPTLEQVENKKKKIDQYKDYAYSNNEISKIVEEKQRFRKTPINYAMTKQELFKDIEIAKDENNIKKEKELRKKLDEMEERASEIDRIRTANNSILEVINRRNRKRTQHNVENALVREAQEHRNVTADPFTRRRCAPTLVSKATVTKEEIIRQLHLQRVADEENAMKKKLEERRLLDEKNKVKQTMITTSDISSSKQINEEKILPAITTRERGSFTSISERHDELFASHDFELDVPIKILPDFI
ncbi:unnamed protein product [Rotaria socialis]|uniref:Plus3 domain-containing protein n=1 Tax=Rotaria socialis TaxID=392032 RepID=A0A817U6H9_9BILA|nr:unnamed protein product [Rotaria socialis]CAF4398384.1 unnamed protein product [Rotaria socialis]